MRLLKNHITLIGNMGAEAQITNFDNGGKVARFTLATDKYTYDSKKKPEWHRVFAWGNVAQFIEEYGEKGRQLAIHGRLVSRTYVSKEGKERKVIEIEVQHIIGL